MPDQPAAPMRPEHDQARVAFPRRRHDAHADQAGEVRQRGATTEAGPDAGRVAATGSRLKLFLYSKHTANQQIRHGLITSSRRMTRVTSRRVPDKGVWGNDGFRN
jgi:hypothetical protein